MPSQICPKIVRAEWQATAASGRGVLDDLSSTQSPCGVTGRTGAWLVFLNGCHRGEDLRLPLGASELGSSWHADLVVSGPGISSRHARLVVADGAATVAPCAPDRHRVLLNGEPVQGPTAVMDGDLLTFAEADAVLRYARAFAPGYRPVIRPRPAVVAPVATGAQIFTAAWLVAAGGRHAGRDWRLIRGKNRLGSAPGLEVTWPEASLPAQACAFEVELDRCALGAWDERLPVRVNGQPAAVGQRLEDSDRLAIGDIDFHVKCL